MLVFFYEIMCFDYELIKIILMKQLQLLALI